MANTNPNKSYGENSWLDTCRITLANGQQFDLKDNVVELSVYEDVYSFCVSGYLLLRDGLGLLNLFQITGGEKLELSFDNSENTDATTIDYIIYKVGDRRPTGNMNSEYYKIFFCSADLLVNEQKKISKSYKGQMITDIVEEAVTTYLGSKRNYSLQKTIGYYDFVVPMMKPLQTISWLSNYSRPENSGTSGTIGADMFFFENRYGYNFYSLSYLMNQPVEKTYQYQQNNLDDDTPDLKYEDDAIIALEHVRSFDILKEVSSGAFANKIIAVDPLTKTQNYQIFDYNQYIEQIAPINGQGVLPNTQTPEGLSPNQTPDTNIKVVLSNSGQKGTNYIKDNDGNSVAQDIYIQQTLSYRTAQTALNNHTVIKIIVPGNAELTVGQTIQLNYLTVMMNPSTNSRDLDNNYSGVYLITGLRHILQSSGVFQTVLEISKNSTIQATQD